MANSTIKVDPIMEYSDVSTTVTAIADIPARSMGRVRLSAAESPTGAEAIFAYVSFGNSKSYRVILVGNVGQDWVYRTSINGGTMRTWDRFALDSQFRSGKFKIIDARANTESLNTIFTGQESASVAIIEGQNEGNAPVTGTYHYVLSFKVSGTYGLQYAMVQSDPPQMYMRRLHNGTWGSWSAFLPDAGKAVISQRYTCNYAISANTYKNLSADDFGITTPSGYTPFSLIEVSSGSNAVCFRAANVSSTGTSAVIVLRNVTSTAVDSANATIKIGYIRNELL